MSAFVTRSRGIVALGVSRLAAGACFLAMLGPEPGEPGENTTPLDALTWWYSQRVLPFDLFGEDFTYRYTKQFNHPSRMRRDLAKLAQQAVHYWDTLPASDRDFDRAKAEFQRRFPL